MLRSCGELYPQRKVRHVSKIGILMEFGQFLKANKKLWLLPMLLVLAFLGIIFALGQYSAVAPFIYTLF